MKVPRSPSKRLGRWWVPWLSQEDPASCSRCPGPLAGFYTSASHLLLKGLPKALALLGLGNEATDRRAMRVIDLGAMVMHEHE